MQLDRWVKCGSHIFSEVYVNNVKSMYASAPGQIVDCTEFILGIYTDIVALYLHVN